MGYIYSITNWTNTDIYIRKTTQSIAEDWAKIVSESREKPSINKLRQRIYKHGTSDLDICCLEECDDSILNERYCFFMKELKGKNI